MIDTRSAAIRLALALIIFTVLLSMAVSLMPVVTVDMQDRFGLSGAQIGFLTSRSCSPWAQAHFPWGSWPLAGEGGRFCWEPLSWLRGRCCLR